MLSLIPFLIECLSMIVITTGSVNRRTRRPSKFSVNRELLSGVPNGPLRSRTTSLPSLPILQEDLGTMDVGEY
jgi:hypothetical protein